MVYRRARQLIGLFLAVAAILLEVSQGLSTAGAVEIQLRDGRKLEGVATRGDSAAPIVLLVGSPRAHFVMRLRRDGIAQITAGNQQWPPDQFDGFLATLPPAASTVDARRVLLQAAGGMPPDAQDAPAVPGTAVPPLSAAEPLRHPPPVLGQVRYVEMEAASSNWDADPEWDGIVVRVRPLDEFGRLVPVEGHLDVTLQTGPNPQPLAPFWSRVHAIGAWQRFVQAGDYGPDGVTLRLPYQGVRPERSNTRRHADQTIESHGDVHLRMTIAGHGVFHASDSYVRIRRFSPLRDRLQVEQGQRFYHGE